MLRTCFLLLICCNSFGQIEEIRRITKTLCSSEFHGRGYVNRGDSIAASFLASEFEKIGIEPYKKSYYQSFLHDVNTFPGAMSIKIGEKVLKPGIHFMVSPSSGGAKEESLSILEIGPEVMRNRERLTDSIGLLFNSNKYNAVVLRLSEMTSEEQKSYGNLGMELMGLLKPGITVLEIVDNKFTWSVSNEKKQNVHCYIQDSIYKSNEKISIDIEAVHHPNYDSKNVIAYVPARKKCTETLLFTAHYDHLGRMGEGTYFPGANDNASGTAMLLTMASYFKQNPIDYNIMFIAFAGEEAGLVGSKFFVDNPLLKLSKIKFIVNLDIMGSGEDGITVVNATLFKKEFELLQKINEEKNLLNEVKERGPAANSDHYWFTENGVPAFFIYTRGPNKHYHDVFDTYSALSFSEYDDITKLLIEFVDRF